MANKPNPHLNKVFCERGYLFGIEIPAKGPRLKYKLQFDKPPKGWPEVVWLYQDQVWDRTHRIQIEIWLPHPNGENGVLPRLPADPRFSRTNTVFGEWLAALGATTLAREIAHNAKLFEEVRVEFDRLESSGKV